MRISHTQLESCLANPRAWYRSALAGESHPYLMGYDRVLRLSIFCFHRSSGPTARDYMEQMIRKHTLRNPSRISEIETSLNRYINWATQESLKVADTKVNIRYEFGYMELRGEIGRVDVTDTGYRAVLLGRAPLDWEKQLRMPLIQAATALMYGRPQGKIEVGFQELDASNLTTRLYTEKQIQAAQHRFVALGLVVRRIAKASKAKGGAAGP
jgi:hypothetical protein